MTPGRPPRVLITRSSHQASGLADRLRALGAEPVLIPAIELAEPASYAALDHALAQLTDFHWLLFTSANAVEAFHRRLKAQQHERFHLAGFGGAGLQPRRREVPQQGALAPEVLPRIAAIGPATARALQSIHFIPDLIPARAVAESLVEALLPHALQADGTPTHFLLVRAEDARDLLPDALCAAGAKVAIAPAYRNIVPEGSIPSIRQMFQQGSAPPDAITFTSSSSVRNLLALCDAAGVELPPGAVRVSIGPITSATLRELGHPPHIEAANASVEALASAVWESLQATS